MSIVHSLSDRLYANPSSVVIRHFQVAIEPRSSNPVVEERVRRIFTMVQAMDQQTIQAELSLVLKDFENRHRQIRNFFEARYTSIAEYLRIEPTSCKDERAVIGAYFCNEYSYQAAALMNPSVVPHPNQSDLSDGELRFLMSLRAVGEGHISSITFREGILTANGEMKLKPVTSFSVAAEPAVDEYGIINLVCQAEQCPQETVLFPVTAAQRNGLEDLRLVKFDHGDSEPVYYGTYTAYSGTAIASEMLITKDFTNFEMHQLHGSASRNKGMALFPRKIDDQYVMVGRQDNENLFILYSDNLFSWNNGIKTAEPQYPWELVQIGNCGSPIELDEGWLLLTHGVGPMRKYAIGAMLLDKNDPTKVLGRSQEPILSPSDAEREGYVPNVVYTCGSLVHNGKLFLPYGIADSTVGFATVDIDQLLQSLQ